MADNPERGDKKEGGEVARTLDVGILRKQRAEKSAMLERINGRLQQIRSQLAEGQAMFHQVEGGISNLNELIAVLDPEGPEAKAVAAQKAANPQPPPETKSKSQKKGTAKKKAQKR